MFVKSVKLHINPQMVEILITDHVRAEIQNNKYSVIKDSLSKMQQITDANILTMLNEDQDFQKHKAALDDLQNG